jgi:cytochrome c551/c552
LALVTVVSAVGCGRKADDAQASAAQAPGADGKPAVTGFAIPPDLDQGPRAASEPVNERLVEQGETLFKTRGCSACHAFGRRLSCPDLDGVTTRRTARWMQTQILHPDAMTKQDPIARQLFAQYMLQMPNQGLSRDDANAVIEFLKHKNQEAGEKH